MSEQQQSPNSQASAPVAPMVNTNPSAPALSITDRAVTQVFQVQERDGKVGTVLRVSVVGGGCSGLSYKLSFEEKPGEKDKVFEKNGLKLVIDPKSLLFLKGTQLDFTDGLEGRGFVFVNPNAKSECGCGSSFSA